MTDDANEIADATVTPADMAGALRFDAALRTPLARRMLCRAADIMDRLAAEIARLKAGGWRPISDAPKDGTDILVGVQGIGWPVRVAFWDEARGGVWSIWPGRELAHPTHWQPLPPPPTDTPEDASVTTHDSMGD
jgi:hypothetical protein